MSQAEWYVAHTYSGYENKVKADIEKTIINRGLEEQILEVCVPMQSVLELKNGAEKTSDRKLFPGYVLIHMIMNDDTWYVVRNTRGVTGFVGPGSKPVALTIDEIYNLGLGGALLERGEKKLILNFELGDLVKVTSGPWEGAKSVITDINEHKKQVKLVLDVFGRETEVWIDFSDIKKED